MCGMFMACKSLPTTQQPEDGFEVKAMMYKHLYEEMKSKNAVSA